jgi:hypothetical protein
MRTRSPDFQAYRWHTRSRGYIESGEATADGMSVVQSAMDAVFRFSPFPETGTQGYRGITVSEFQCSARFPLKRCYLG